MAAISMRGRHTTTTSSSVARTAHWMILVWFVVATLSLAISGQTDSLLEDISSLPTVPEHSFQNPFLYGTSVIPYWDYGGSAVASEDMIRLVPAIRSRTGWIWNQVPAQMNNWQIDVDFKIHNTRSPGADGMAIWYTYERAIPGGLYGNTDTFNGMGIIFDTYDNDGMRDNPRVVLITNQGNSQRWDVDHDLQENQLASCISYFRNTRNNVKARIRYERSIVTVELDTDGTGERYQACLQARNVALKPGGYFGITAATGGLADFHDVFNFLVRDLDEKPGNAPAPAPATPTPDPQDAGHAFARRRRGLFDPFRDLSHTPPRAADTPTKDTAPATATATPENPNGGGEESVDQLVARFREQIEKLREEKKKEHQEETPAPVANPPVTENPPTHQHPQLPDPPATAPSSTPQDAESVSRQSVDELSSIILTAFKNVVDEVKRTDSSVHQLTNKVIDVSNKQTELQNTLNVVKLELSRQVTTSSESSKTRSDKLQEQIHSLTGKVSEMRNQLDSLSKVTGHTSQTWKESANELSQKISREAGWGFWTYFVFFLCIVIVVGIIWWRTSPSQREKNLRYLS